MLVVHHLECGLLNERSPRTPFTPGILAPPIGPTLQPGHVEQTSRDLELRDVQPVIEATCEHGEPRAGLLVERPETTVKAGDVAPQRPCACLEQAFRIRLTRSGRVVVDAP